MIINFVAAAKKAYATRGGEDEMTALLLSMNNVIDNTMLKFDSDGNRRPGNVFALGDGDNSYYSKVRGRKQRVSNEALTRVFGGAIDNRLVTIHGNSQV